MLNRLDKATETVGMMKAYEPPITTGSRVPNKVCKSVFIPATKSIVSITSAFSTYLQYRRTIGFRKKTHKQGWESNMQVLFCAFSYITTAHQRDKYGGYNYSSPEHY